MLGSEELKARSSSTVILVNNAGMGSAEEPLRHKLLRTYLIICSTCLQYFGLSEKVEAGIVGGMNDILLAQWMASKVITL
jgi:hypothetical protein